MPADQIAFPNHFFDKVCAAARERGQGWQALATILEVPTREFVTDLRSGDLAQLLSHSAAWLGDDQHMLTAELMSLGVYARGSVRRDLDKDLADLIADHSSVIGEQPVLIAALQSLGQQCADESVAWQARDVALGKELRSLQNDFIESDVAADLVNLCVTVAQDASLNILRTLAKLILAYLSADTGRDYQRAALSPKVKPGGLVDAKGFLRLYEQT